MPPRPTATTRRRPQTGITAWQFPEWFITQDVERGGRMTRSRLLVHRKALTKGKFIDDDKKQRPVVPIRFVRACRKGHIGDIDWYGFVHRRNDAALPPPTVDRRARHQRRHRRDRDPLRVRQGSAAEATPRIDRAPGALRRRSALARAVHKEACDELNRLLVRHASNAYFPQIMSVISLPDRNETLEKAVNQVWENFLQYVDTLDELKKERQKKPPVKAALEGFTDDGGTPGDRGPQGAGRGAGQVGQAGRVRGADATKDEVGQDTPDGDFFARALPKTRLGQALDGQR